MSDTNPTFTDIVGLWPTVAEFAGDLGVSVARARKWASRNSIPGEWFMAVTVAAQRRGFDHVNTRVLSKIADDGRSLSLTARDQGNHPVTGGTPSEDAA